MSDERAWAGGRLVNDGVFDRNSPRPPVPGEEQAPCTSDWGPPQAEYGKREAASPILGKCLNTVDEKFTTMGHEPDPSTASSSAGSRHDKSESLPACLMWAKSLHHLLKDPDGAELFKTYLQSEGGQHSHALDFWFACRGLQNIMDRDTTQQFAKVIYRRFFVKSTLPINEDLRKEIGKNLKSSACLDPPVTLFDEAQAQILNIISNTTYPNFLKSDMYLQYIQSVQNPSSGSEECNSESSSSSGSNSTKLVNLTSNTGPLPTLHEDMEFVPSSTVPLSHTPGTGCMSTGYHTPNLAGPVRLTKDMLLVTQKHRAMDVCPKPEAFAGMYMYRGVHAAYNSYNPVSRQDSEMQSVSSHSDARTESDNMSLTDSSIDGRSMGASSRRRAAMEARQAKQSAALNKETHQTLIPRTQRLESRQYQPMNPQQFAAILIEKLESVKRDQESQELLDKKLKDSESMTLEEKTRLNDLQSRQLANAIRERLLVDDDDDQDILDQHVSRVFSDLTPSKSPRSPRGHSPARGRQRPRRRDRDGFSTFSGDSGNVYDLPEGMVKSRSVPEYGDERFSRSSASRRSSSKKTLTDLTDSGVSVISDTPPVVQDVKDQSRVIAWVRELDRSGRNVSYTHSEMSTKHRSHRTSSATSPNASRHRKAYGSRSNSLERTPLPGPNQPFVADPSMPPPPIPNTSMQLEEARRRLEDDLRARGRAKGVAGAPSGHSTLRKCARGGARAEEVTTVVFSFCDEEFPYRTKIPGLCVTLRQFKEYLPKKGNYRFFFKTVCEELGDQVIQEEICNDADVLPLCEGKIMAQVKSID